MTITAPTITPCPVSWCTEHEQMSEDPHPQVRQSAPVHMTYPDDTRPDGRRFEVSPEVWVDEAQNTKGCVYINDEGDGELHSAAEVRGFVDALDRASLLVFGDPTRDARAEFDAALAELVARAGNPSDVNRLVAAAIRLRNAHAALCGVTR